MEGQNALIPGVTQKLILGVGSDTMLGQEVTPQMRICLLIWVVHSYIHEGVALEFHLPMTLHFLLFIIYTIYNCSPNPYD